jgi:hypothetical protein
LSRTQWKVWLTQCSDLLRTCQAATAGAVAAVER